MADSIAQFKKMLDVNTFGTFVVNAHISDAINSQYPDQAEKLPPRVNEERGIIVNYASAAARPYARVLGYGPTKSKSTSKRYQSEMLQNTDLTIWSSSFISL